VGNFFNNIRTPIPLVNHLLQGKPGRAGRDLARFGINSTVGVLGLFDVAESRFDMPRNDTGFSDTLVQYGTGYGTYLVLPLMGPSNVRDGSAFVLDSFLNPLTFILDIPEGIVVRGFDHFQHYAPSAEAVSGYQGRKRRSLHFSQKSSFAGNSTGCRLQRNN
jgi:phospholipid-binding lipoprotein MlaA